MKRSKAYRAAAEQIDRNRLYSPAEAVALARKTSPAKFDPTVEVFLASATASAGLYRRARSICPAAARYALLRFMMSPS